MYMYMYDYMHQYNAAIIMIYNIIVESLGFITAKFMWLPRISKKYTNYRKQVCICFNVQKLYENTEKNIDFPWKLVPTNLNDSEIPNNLWHSLINMQCI